MSAQENVAVIEIIMRGNNINGIKDLRNKLLATGRARVEIKEPSSKFREPLAVIVTIITLITDIAILIDLIKKHLSSSASPGIINIKVKIDGREVKITAPVEEIDKLLNELKNLFHKNP